MTPGIFDVLNTIKDLNLSTAVLSNFRYNGKVLEWELNRHGLLEYFKFTMSSSDYSFKKPFPMVYQIAAKKLGFQPQDIWYIGDSLISDIHGALKAGMCGIWYNDSSKPIIEPQPSAVVENWAEFKELFLKCME